MNGAISTWAQNRHANERKVGSCCAKLALGDRACLSNLRMCFPLAADPLSNEGSSDGEALIQRGYGSIDDDLARQGVQRKGEPLLGDEELSLPPRHLVETNGHR